MSTEERKLSVDGHVYRYGLVNGTRCWYTGYSCQVAVDDETERLLAVLSTAERERGDLEHEYRELCLVLRTAVERHKFGLGGERLEALLIQALDERTAALRHILRVYELPDVGPLDDAVERARASLARVPSGGA